jgi:hypothetical protein
VDISCQPDDGLARLRAAYPQWSIESRWVTTASGPDRCHWMAHRGPITVAGWTLADLAAEMRRQDGQ